MSLGENIYKLRTKKKLSQEDFAAAMEVSRQSVSKWENNMAVPELDKLIRMAKLFEVSLDELVGNAPPQPQPQPKPEPQPEPKSVSVPAPTQPFSSGDLISAVLLILGVICPFLVMYLYMTSFKDNLVVYLIQWCLFPPLVTFGASRCSPNNQLMHRVYMVYNILWGVAEFIFTAPIGLFACLFNFGIMMHWYSRLESE